MIKQVPRLGYEKHVSKRFSQQFFKNENMITILQAFNPDFVSSVKWFVGMVVASSVVLTLLIGVSVIHQVRLQSLHLLLPVVVSQCVAAKPPVFS